MSVSNKTKGILFTAVILALLLATLIGLTFILRIPSSGTIKAIGCAVYFDATLTQNVTSINWGTVAPGSETNVSVYILNTGTAPANLTLGTQNWVPTVASNYIALFWNYNNSTLAVNQAIPVTFMLDVYSNVTGIKNFTFTIDIVANG